MTPDASHRDVLHAQGAAQPFSEKLSAETDALRPLYINTACGEETAEGTQEKLEGTQEKLEGTCENLQAIQGNLQAIQCEPDAGEIAADAAEPEADEEDEGLSSTLYEHFRIVADKGQQLLRVDKFLLDHLRDTSRHRIQLAARAGFIHVNGKPVRQNYRVKPHDIVTLVLDRPRFDTTIEPEDIPIRIVYEDECLLVVDKAAGMVVHPGCGNYHGTLINAVAWHLRDDKAFDVNDPAVGLVHRIDKDTSGLLLVAKTVDAKTRLGLQFFNKTTRRTYNALVWGNLPADSGRIEGNIGRDPKDRLRMAVFDPASGIGKHAVTHWRVLERFGYVTLVECRLETGRTHQIRAHMAHIGHPLFADERYGGTAILRGQPTASYKAFIHHCFDLCPRQALHARTLGFCHPTTQKEMDFTSPLAPDLEALIQKWRDFAQTRLKPEHA